MMAQREMEMIQQSGPLPASAEEPGSAASTYRVVLNQL